MTDAELIEYFENIDLPAMVRVDRATTQFDLPKYVQYYIKKLKQKPDNEPIRFWLLRIKTALDEPFKGQAIPKM